jgi:integrase
MPKAKARDGVYYRADRRSWWVSYTDATGKRRRHSVVAHTRPQAVEALARLKVQTERHKALGVKEASDISTHDLLERFRRHQKVRLRATTFDRLGGILKTLEANLPELAKNIGKKSVAAYIETRSETVSPGTIAKEVSTLKHALRLAVEWGELHENAASGARLPKQPEGKTRYLTPGELRAALEIAPEWMRAPMALAVSTGMRRGSLLSLRWMDCDFKQRCLYIRTKTKPQVLPMNSAALQVLGSLPQGASADLVFAGVDGQKLSVYTRRVFQKLGIMDASFHTLRHTAASWMVQAGVDLYGVGQFLGHKTPRMTTRYAHLSPGYMAEAAGKLGNAMREVLPGNGQKPLRIVTIASPDFQSDVSVASKLLQ